jgi:hypothetical protein
MIVVKIIGGLGNQLFQYATAKALAIKNNDSLRLDVSAFSTYKTHAYGLHHFNTSRKTYKNKTSKFMRKLYYKLKRYKNYYEPAFNYNPQLLETKYHTLFLNGYFQSEQYFLDCRDVILKDLKVVSALKPETQALIKEVQACNSVSVHIRRGDYLLHELHNTSKEVYYNKALDYIISHVTSPVYYLFSDDMDWVKANFKTNSKTVYVDINDAASNYEDLSIMSHCKHNIIANSSFSWWGAWLNENPDKIVTAPEVWFNDDTMDYSDVVPKSWVKLGET